MLRNLDKQFKNKSKEYISRTLKNPKIKLKTKLKNILITYFQVYRLYYKIQEKNHKK